MFRGIKMFDISVRRADNIRAIAGIRLCTSFYIDGFCIGTERDYINFLTSRYTDYDTEETFCCDSYVCH